MIPLPNRPPRTAFTVLNRKWMVHALSQMDAHYITWSSWDAGEHLLIPLAEASLTEDLLPPASPGSAPPSRKALDPAANPMLRRMLRTRAPVTGPWFAFVGEYVPWAAAQQLWREGTLRYCCAVPLIWHDDLVGVVSWTDRHPFGPDRQRLGWQLVQSVRKLGAQAKRLALPTQPAARQRIPEPLLLVEDRVRREVAEVLHGPVQAALLVAEDRVRACQEQVTASNPKMARELATVLDLLEDVREREIRPLSHRLHPTLLQLGLRAALFGLIRFWQTTVRVNLRVDEAITAADDPLSNQIPPAVRLAAYRLAEEATNNAVRHGKARCVTIEVGKVGDAIWISVTDNGQGFNEAWVPGYGLTALQSRLQTLGGTWTLERDHDRQLTMLTAHIPYIALSGRSPEAGTGLPT